ncbi:U1 zinc finger-domain-containing protein [Geranomyces variabilis]|nr:U1 zinc finger-domain-containing protein [Geranomyces variabilis]KAJ3140019.1 hypothetical protein HDU90_008923 [Geranomyces variabilis]
MPEYYCDYCDCILTHDSLSARRDHNKGKIHRQQVRDYYFALESDKKEQIIETLTAAYADVPGGSGTVMAYECGGFHGNGVGHMNGHFGVPPPLYEMGRYGGPSGFQHHPGFLPGPPFGIAGPPSQSGRTLPPGGRFAPYQRRPHHPSYDHHGAGRPSPARMPWMPRPPYMQDGMYKK